MRGVNAGHVRTRAVLFSLGALSSCEGAEELAAITFRAMVARFDIRGDAAQSYGLFCSRFAQAARWYQDQRAYRQADMLRSARLAGLRALGVKPTEADLDELDADCRESLAKKMQPRPGALDVLAMLREQGIRSGMVTNADCEQFRGMVAATGLAQSLDLVLCSEEAGSCKPDPLIFYEALRRLGCRPSEALFVGTSPELDVRGARLVGMRAALLAAKGPRWWDHAECEAEHMVATLHEVTSLARLPAPAGGPRVRRRDSRSAAAAR